MSAALVSVAAITNTVEITHRDGPCHPLYPHTDRAHMAPGGLPKQRTHRRSINSRFACGRVHTTVFQVSLLRCCLPLTPVDAKSSRAQRIVAQISQAPRWVCSRAQDRQATPPNPQRKLIVPSGDSLQPTSFGVLTYAKRLQLPPGSLGRSRPRNPGLQGLWGRSNVRSKQLPFREDIFRTTAPGTALKATQHMIAVA